MSQKRYTQMESVDDGPIIQIMEKFTLGDKVAVDTTSYNNRLIYYKKELPGFLIDLNGYIDKPFDPRFYEVYLNGRRLTARNLKAISPYEVQLNHVHSLYNFAILCA